VAHFNADWKLAHTPAKILAASWFGSSSFVELPGHHPMKFVEEFFGFLFALALQGCVIMLAEAFPDRAPFAHEADVFDGPGLQVADKESAYLRTAD